MNLKKLGEKSRILIIFLTMRYSEVMGEQLWRLINGNITQVGGLEAYSMDEQLTSPSSRTITMIRRLQH